MKMKIVLAIAGPLLMAACGNSERQAGAVTSSAQAPKGIVEAITTAGGSCGQPDKRGEQKCVLSGIGFKLGAGESWTRQSGSRAMACKGGYINANYTVLTNEHWVIAVDHTAELDAIQNALAGHGVPADVRNYCP